MEIILFFLCIFFVVKMLHWKEKARDNEITLIAIRENERNLMKKNQELQLQLEKAMQDYWSKT